MQEVTKRLIDLHGKPKREVDPLETYNGCHGQTEMLDSLIRILLSQNTTDITSIRAFHSLKERFPTWENVHDAPNSQIEDAIRVGGLAQIKAERMKALLRHLKEEKGKCCLEWLRVESTATIKNYLKQFKGMGPKTISCMLLFCLDRADFPVDTHVYNIAKALKFIPDTYTREQAYEHLNETVPDDVKFDLHVLLVEHGKVCERCSRRSKKRSSNGNHIRCPLIDLKTINCM